jgi:hypothetical protein
MKIFYFLKHKKEYIMLYLIDIIDDKEDQKLDCSIFNDENNTTHTLNVNYKNSKRICVKCDCGIDDDSKSNNMIMTNLTNLYLFFMFNTQKKECIHKKWINTYYFDEIRTKDWTIHHVNFLKEFNIPNNNNQYDSCKNTECIICLDDIHYNNQNMYYCNICKNAVHSICWHQYVILNYYADCTKCCICKTGDIPHRSLLY